MKMENFPPPEPFKYGTYYHCGCWYRGHPDENPSFCMSHNRIWKYKYDRDDEGNYIIKENVL